MNPYLLITVDSARAVVILENSAGCNRKLPIDIQLWEPWLLTPSTSVASSSSITAPYATQATLGHRLAGNNRIITTAVRSEMHIQIRCMPYFWLKSKMVPLSPCSTEKMFIQPKNTSAR